MSFEALAWAAKQTPGNMAAKMVLLALANYANENGHSYPSAKAVALFGDMNIKTVPAALARLEASGLIFDTGFRKGSTHQIKVFKLAIESHPKTDVFDDERHPKTGNYKGGKTPVFGLKDTQKRVTEPIINLLEDDKSSSYTPSRKDDPFPKPDWADDQVWGDFLKNRKAKKLPNTATAYSRLMADLNRLADAEWPPGRLLEHAAAKGWGGIYDPRGKDNGTANRTSTKPPAATDGFAASLRYVANQTDHDGWHQERCGLPEIDALGGEFH